MAFRATATSVPISSKPERGSRQKAQPWFKIRYLAVLVVLVWAGIRFWHVEMPQVTQLAQQKHQLESQLKNLQTQQSKLQVQVAEFKNNSFLAAYAGQHYQMVAPGQVMFTVSSKH